MRASFLDGTEQAAGLGASAHSVKREDDRQALRLLQAIAGNVSPNALFASSWDHGDASFWLRDTIAEGQAFARKSEQPLRAATFRSAEFQISRQ